MPSNSYQFVCIVLPVELAVCFVAGETDRRWAMVTAVAGTFGFPTFGEGPELLCWQF